MRGNTLLMLYASSASTFTTAAFSAAFSAVATNRPDTSNIRELLLSDVPLLDVRAPVEYEAGSIIPATINIPILNNEERHEIGICYKEHGQEAAIVLGNQLVTGTLKADRMKQWAEFARSNPDGYLYCFRGGLRSRTVQEWLELETGIRYPLIEGGYKKMRQFLMDELERSLDPERSDLIIIAGKTGVGKTRVIDHLGPQRSIDLEGLAHHRGSSFGDTPEDIRQQSISQIDFENSISMSLLKLLAAADSPTDDDMRQRERTRVYVEDEGSRIGRFTLPHTLWTGMKQCNKLVIVDEDLEDRVTMILEDYIFDYGRRFVALYGEELGPVLHREKMLGDLARIRNKKLGSENLARLTGIMGSAFDEQESSGDTALHRVWISDLLSQYYDPMYEYQLSQRVDPEVLFRGKCNEVSQWAANN